MMLFLLLAGASVWGQAAAGLNPHLNSCTDGTFGLNAFKYYCTTNVPNNPCVPEVSGWKTISGQPIITSESGVKVVELRSHPSGQRFEGDSDGIFFDFENNTQNGIGYKWPSEINHAAQTLTITYECRYISGTSQPWRLDWILCDEFYKSGFQSYCYPYNMGYMPIFDENDPNRRGQLVTDNRIQIQGVTTQWQTVTQKVYIPSNVTFKKLWLRLSCPGLSLDASWLRIRNVSIGTCNIAATITGNTQYCAGSATTLTASGSNGTAPYTYKWSSNAPTNTSPTTVVATAGTYTVTVADSRGCTTTRTQTVSATAPPTVTITGNTQVCAGQNTTLTASGGGTYLWSNGSPQPSISVGAGTYTVTVTNNGCTATKSATVTTAPSPTVSITGDPNIATTNGSTVLTAVSSITLATFVWSTTPLQTMASATITQAGIYTVTATVTATGCTATASITVIAKECYIQGYEMIGTTGDSTYLLSLVGININNDWLSNPGQGSHFTCNVPPTINLKWVIRGQLIINAITIMPNVDFRMCADASIRIGLYDGEVDTFGDPNPDPNRLLNIGYAISNAATLSSLHTIQGIDKMWEGITVLKTSHLLIAPTLSKDFTIKNARIAVKAHYGSQINASGRNVLSGVRRNKFIDNGIGILFCKKGNSTTTLPNSGISSIDFWATAPLLPPLSTQWAQTGIEMNDLPNPLATTADAANYFTFTKLKYGIKANNSTITYLSDMTFTDIDEWSPSPTVGVPTAIVLENKSVLSATQNSTAKITILGSLSGVLADNSNAEVKAAIIAANPANARPTVVGITFQNGNNNTLSVTKCQIDVIGSAIALYQNNNSTITVQDNKPTTANPNAGLLSTSTASGSIGASAVSINHNTAQRNKIRIINNTIDANKSYGVYMNGVVADANSPTNSTVLQSNSISFTNSAVLYKKAGIGAENCKNLYLHSNTITGTNVADNSAWSAGHYFPSAIQIAATTNADLCSNTTQNTRTGILFNATCTGSKMTLNKINQHQTGLSYRPTLVLDPQVDGGNTFQNGYNYPDAGARNMAIDLNSGTIPGRIETNQFGTDVNGRPYWAPNQKSNELSLQTWFKSSPYSQSTVCTTLPTLANLTYKEQIAAGLIQTNEFPLEMEWSAKQTLYEELSQNNAAANSAILQNFKDSIEYTPTGELTDVKNDAVTLFTPSETYKLQLANYETQLTAQKEAIGAIYANMEDDPANAAAYEVQLNQANALFEMTNMAYENLQATQKAFESNAADNLKAQNAAIQPLLLQEFNQKAVNDIYFSTIAKAQPLNETGRGANHIAILEQISLQCPYTGGPAVYEARSLLANHTTTDYDDQAICAAAGINYRKKPTVSKSGEKSPFGGLGGVSFMPNPASTQVLLQFQGTGATGNILLIDALGRTVLSRAYNGNVHQILSVEDVTNGIYFVQFVSDTNEITHIGKLSVVK